MISNPGKSRWTTVSAIAVILGGLLALPAMAEAGRGQGSSRGTAAKASDTRGKASGGVARGTASRTRGGSARATSRAHQSAKARGTVSARQSTARGQATYGHGGYYGGHYAGYARPYYHYGSFGYPYYPLYAAWAWPYWGGYYPPTQTVVVNRYSSETIPAILETDVKPRKAELRIDGEYVGQARDFSGRWDRLEIEPGTRVIEFSHEGYLTLRRVVRVRPGGYVTVMERLRSGDGLDPRSQEPPSPDELEREAKTDSEERRARPDVAESRSEGNLRRGMLRLDVGPPDAVVYLDGEFLARAGELERLHGALPVAQGPHTIEIVRPGYRSESRQIEVLDEEPVTLKIELSRN